MFGGGENKGVGGRISSILGGGGGQWGSEETRELILIRGELERDFTAAKRNKTLWEIVSARMRSRGYIRTPDQCKCKWKNLLNRYKGKETSDPENGRQLPFLEELHEVFTERGKKMQRLLLESEAGSTQAKKRMKRISADRSSDEFSEEEEEDDDEDESEEERHPKNISRKRKADRIALHKSPGPNSATSTSTTTTNTGLHEMFREFFQQQQRMEMQWWELMDRRARERQLFEQEWRQSMERLERERLKVEQAWREREEQRRLREESQAERRDALLTTLLSKLINENSL